MTTVPAVPHGTPGVRDAPVPAGFSRDWWSGTVPFPTLRAAAVLAVAVPLLWLAPVTIPFWVPLVVVALAVAADACLTPAPWRIGVDRELPTTVALGTDSELAWRVRNPVARAVTVELADELVPSLGAGSRRTRMTVPPSGRRRVTTRLAPTRRGTFTPTRVTVRVVGGLGLGQRQADRSLPGHLEVHPGFRSRAAAELRVRRHRVLDEGLRAIRARGAGTQFDTLRDYVEGDDVRRVDWTATARAGHPVVRTFRAERNQQVLALLDSGRLSAALVDGVPRLDHAMDALLALATIAARSGDRTGMLAFGAEVRAVVPPRGDRGHLRRLSTAMHALQPELAESDYGAAFRTALGRFPSQATLVLFTELGAEAVEEQLLPALPLLTRRHAVTVVAVRDPALQRARTMVARTVDDAYRTAAAAAIAAQRARTASLLRRCGVQVVDAVPTDLAGAVADAYLETKARGR
ncbi:DUF58 domain-containing protein [Egicoccus sp. AB-alg6-2]|uniref:DUF58 domain-containing protein n=1 Tax=Egicoccus sp. AB-alg6-2 TaxID=3242692 RepID=UPI00359CC6F0